MAITSGWRQRRCEPNWNYLRGKRNNELHKPVIDVIEDIRASFMPPCDHATVGGQPAAGK
jgi:hypothetical protein